MISVTVNGRPKKVGNGTTLADFVKSHNIAGGPAVIELNGEIVRKPDLASTRLKDGDKIEVATLVGGG